MKYNVTICREVWGVISVEASSESEARRKVADGDYDGDFEPNGKIGNEGVYYATPAEVPANESA